MQVHGEYPAQCLANVGHLINVSFLPCARNKELRWRNRRRGGNKMEVPAQHSGDKAWQVPGKAGVELARERSVTFPESLLMPREREGVFESVWVPVTSCPKLGWPGKPQTCTADNLEAGGPRSRC